jgi:hypothetical protein
MDPFDQKPIFPVDVMITLAINIVVTVLGYYLIMAGGLLGGDHPAEPHKRDHHARPLLNPSSVSLQIRGWSLIKTAQLR